MTEDQTGDNPAAAGYSAEIEYNQHVATKLTRRSYAGVARFFEGLDLVEPGIVQHHRSRPDPGVNAGQYEVHGWSVLGRKPSEFPEAS